jgi:energy-coupling factor transporter ATP-binding protein EcfA2
MQMFRKIGDEVILIYNPRNESVEVGDSIKVLDKSAGRGLIVQVIEESLVDLAGILEDIIRTESIGEIKVETYAPPEYEKYKLDVRNMKFARAKIRKELKVDDKGESIGDWSGWVPDRSAEVSPVDEDWLMEKLGIKKEFFKHPIMLGETKHSKKAMSISAFHLQGITIIVGKKGCGKSHIAKSLLLGLIDQKAKGIVFDINDEYTSMRLNADDNQPSPYFDRIIPLDPGVNMRFTLPYIGADVFFDVIQTTMGLPEASAYELRNLWDDLEKRNNLSFENLRNAAENTLDRRILGAITRRLDRMQQTNLFSDDPNQAITLEGKLNNIQEGGALVINLKMKNKDTVDLVVQTVLRKIQEILEKGYSPMFIFAEEAHMYLRETNWDDAVTRMRHLGTYQIYMTNTPTEIRPLVIRQADNLVLFHLTEPGDIQHISPAAKIDPETIEQVAKALPFRTCLIIGEATNHYPFIIETAQLNVQTAGKTRLYFEEP